MSVETLNGPVQFLTEIIRVKTVEIGTLTTDVDSRKQPAYGFANYAEKSYLHLGLIISLADAGLLCNECCFACAFRCD